MIHTQISERFSRHFAAHHLLHEAGEAALSIKMFPFETSLTIVIEDAGVLRGLNKEFRGIDKITDVLSFPSDDTDPDTGAKYLGDVVISYPTAEEQAEAKNHTIEDELRILIVHGILHLLSYDHDTPENKAAMWKVQAEILTELGLPETSHPE